MINYFAMKKIIAFVLFALMIYAGVYLVVYGFKELAIVNSYPLPLDMVSSGTIHNDTVLGGKVTQQVKCLKEDIIRTEIFSIPIGKPIKRRFYLVPVRYEENAKDLRYYTVCVSGEESIAQMDKLWVMFPEPESGGGFEIKGVAEGITSDIKSRAYSVLTSRTQLVGVDGFLRNPMPNYYYDRIVPFIVYERRTFGTEWISVAIGAALILGGIISAVFLGIKIHRERY